MPLGIVAPREAIESRMVRQPVQAVEALAQVARLQADKHLQAARKTQHEAVGFSKPRNKAAANSIWFKSPISRQAPRLSRTINFAESLLPCT